MGGGERGAMEHLDQQTLQQAAEGVLGASWMPGSSPGFPQLVPPLGESKAGLRASSGSLGLAALQREQVWE